MVLRDDYIRFFPARATVISISEPAGSFCESFTKFSILKRNEREAIERIHHLTSDPGILDAKVECRFVVPFGCRSIEALGWRHQVDRTLMDIEKIEVLDNETRPLQVVAG